jgi:hypothetical protein
MEDWKCVYSTQQRYQADMVKSILRDRGDIDAVVMDKKDSAYTVFGDIEVYVQPENEHLAVELIKDSGIE